MFHARPHGPHWNKPQVLHFHLGERELKTTRGMDRLAKQLEQSSHSIGRGKREDRSGHSCLMASVQVWMLHFQPFSLSAGWALPKVKNLPSQAPWLSLAFLILLIMEGATWVGWVRFRGIWWFRCLESNSRDQILVLFFTTLWLWQVSYALWEVKSVVLCRASLRVEYEDLCRVCRRTPHTQEKLKVHA